jgi:hypothetical protein
VIDRLRVFLNRPLRDTERRRLFVAAIAVILAGAGALALLDRPASRPQRSARSSSPAPPPAQPAAVPVGDAVSLEAPSEEGTPRKGLEGSRADVAATKRTATRFLAGYLAYTYGRRPARGIASASVQLRRHLAAQPPRVPVGERHRHPRVVLVQSNGVGRVRAELVALVGDGARRYTVPLELARAHSGWKVTAVGS